MSHIRVSKINKNRINDFTGTSIITEQLSSEEEELTQIVEDIIDDAYHLDELRNLVRNNNDNIVPMNSVDSEDNIFNESSDDSEDMEADKVLTGTFTGTFQGYSFTIDVIAKPI